MSTKTFSVTLRVWRQPGPGKPGRFAEYTASGVNPDMSFLEMLDVVNDELTAKGEEPIAFAHDCREGICGTCSLTIDGKPHGPNHGVATCQTYMRSYSEGDRIVIEPFRARPFPVVKDLVTDRSAFDKIQQAGGFITARTGSAPDANATPVPKEVADLAMDAAQCIGCGACVAACKNLIAWGKAKAVALTLGSQGAIFVTPEGAWRAWPLPIQPVSTVGAGDSFLAAMVCALASGHPPSEALRHGVAGGSAALLAPGTQLCHLGDMRELLGHVVVDRAG